MDGKKITFKKAGKADKTRLKGWLDKPHVKESWDPGKEFWESFESSLGDEAPLGCWLCLYDKKPFGLIMTYDASTPNPKTGKQHESFVSWVEPEGKTLAIDFAIGEESFLGQGLSEITLKKFAEFQDPAVTALLVDPEVKNEKALHIFEKAGFVRVSTFIRGEGFFKGKPHYLLKLKISHTESGPIHS